MTEYEYYAGVQNLYSAHSSSLFVRNYELQSGLVKLITASERAPCLQPGGLVAQKVSHIHVPCSVHELYYGM